MSLRIDLHELIQSIYTWAGRPTKDGAKNLRDLASKFEEKYENKSKGLDVVFYDRKNQREVKASELMKIKFVQNIVICDDQELAPSGRRYLKPLENKRQWYPEPVTEDDFESMIHTGVLKREEYPAFNEMEQEKSVKYGKPKDQILGEFGYRSNLCRDYENWDLYCMSHDLIFLRVE